MYMFLTIISMFKCLEFTPYLKMFNLHAFACNIVYLRTEVLHGPGFLLRSLKFFMACSVEES